MLETKIDSLLITYKQKPFNGNILIARNGKIEYSKYNGYSDLENTILLDANSQFVIGSISKQFTATIVLREYDNQHIELFVPIRNYLPELSQSWADTVTVHHLLTHTHGIIALDKPTLFSVGTAYNYSQIGYDLLAQIAEKASGKSFAELSSELFALCGMKATFYPDLKGYNHLAKGYIEDDNTLIYTDQSFQYYPAAGAFISTVNDLMLWNEKLFEGKLLKEKTFEMMTSKQKNAVRNHPIFGFTEYSYGITIDDNNNQIQWGQTGLVPGFVSMNFYFPKTRTSVIVLGNVSYNPDDVKKTFEYHMDVLDIVQKTLLSNTN